MAEITVEAQQGILFFALAGASEESLRAARRRLALDFSEIETESSIIPAENDFSPETKVSQPVFRLWVATSLPVYLTEAADIKRFTRRLEESLAPIPDRAVSVEPGYVTASKVVRLLNDDAAHRIQLQRGVYAEAVLRFDHGPAAESWPWTPSEYRSPTATDFFLRVRQCLSANRNSELSQKV